MPKVVDLYTLLRQQHILGTIRTPRSPSSSGLGHRPFTAVTGVRTPLGTPLVPRLFRDRNGRGQAVSAQTLVYLQEASLRLPEMRRVLREGKAIAEIHPVAPKVPSWKQRPARPLVVSGTEISQLILEERVE